MEHTVILLVEDNADEEALTRRALKTDHMKIELVVAHDGVEALDYLFAAGDHAGRDPSVMPRLVLLDLKLPKVTGLEVLERLRSDDRTKLLPVVILSLSHEAKDIIDGYTLGANSYIRKPVNFSQFHDAIRNVTDYWLRVNERPPAHLLNFQPGGTSFNNGAAMNCSE